MDNTNSQDIKLQKLKEYRKNYYKQNREKELKYKKDNYNYQYKENKQYNYKITIEGVDFIFKKKSDIINLIQKIKIV
jgi:hypothetical protein